MRIRRTVYDDIPRLLEIFAHGRKIQKATGNAGQWVEGHPSKEMIKKDIDLKQSYVCITEKEDSEKLPLGTVVATIVVQATPEPTYEFIKDGEWLNEDPYVTIHRVATSGEVKGAGRFCLKYVTDNYDNIRIDTHQKNKPMLALIEKFGFEYCGIIYVQDGSERVAFQLAQ